MRPSYSTRLESNDGSMDLRDLPTDTVEEDQVAETHLLVLWNGGTIAYPLEHGRSLVIGRGADVDVQIDHSSVSRRHAILHVGDTILIEDLGSSNGTRVANRRLDREATAPVAPGVLMSSALSCSSSKARPMTRPRAREAPASLSSSTRRWRASTSCSISAPRARSA